LPTDSPKLPALYEHTAPLDVQPTKLRSQTLPSDQKLSPDTEHHLLHKPRSLKTSYIVNTPEAAAKRPPHQASTSLTNDGLQQPPSDMPHYVSPRPTQRPNSELNTGAEGHYVSPRPAKRCDSQEDLLHKRVSKTNSTPRRSCYEEAFATSTKSNTGTKEPYITPRPAKRWNSQQEGIYKDVSKTNSTPRSCYEEQFTTATKPRRPKPRPRPQSTCYELDPPTITANEQTQEPINGKIPVLIYFCLLVLPIIEVTEIGFYLLEFC